jgi:hypothetical protein
LANHSPFDTIGDIRDYADCMGISRDDAHSLEMESRLILMIDRLGPMYMKARLPTAIFSTHTKIKGFTNPLPECQNQGNAERIKE